MDVVVKRGEASKRGISLFPGCFLSDRFTCILDENIKNKSKGKITLYGMKHSAIERAFILIKILIYIDVLFVGEWVVEVNFRK